MATIAPASAASTAAWIVVQGLAALPSPSPPPYAAPTYCVEASTGTVPHGPPPPGATPRQSIPPCPALPPPIRGVDVLRGGLHRDRAPRARAARRDLAAVDLSRHCHQPVGTSGFGKHDIAAALPVRDEPGPALLGRDARGNARAVRV